MKKASNIRLSLRKLLIATLAVGPLAVLPAPVWAAVPAAAPYTVTSGTATWSTSGTAGTVQASDKAVLVWGAGTFNIAVGETFNFTLPTGGAILNKVGYTTAGGLAAVDTATIDGTLFSTGKVFILANGNINIGGTAAITTNGGLFLSTLQETSDFSFSTVGSLSGTGASTGTITVGAAGASPSISGLLDASAGTIVSHRASVTGDVIYRTVTAGAASAIDLAQSGSLVAGGNLTVTTNGGAITGTNAITVGGQVTGNQTATLSTGVTTGAGVAVTLANAANDFEIVSVNAAGTTANVTLADANIITLGASTVGQDLIVTAVGTAGTTGVQNSGTVTIGRDASFTVTTNNSGVSVSNSSTVGRNLAGSTLNSGFTFNGSGNITIGTVGALNGIQITPLAGAGGNRSAVSVTAGNGTLSVTQPVSTSGNGTSGGGITLTAGTIATSGAGSVTQSTATGSTVTLNATTGGISIGAGVTGDKLTIRTAGGAITQTLAGVLSTANSGSNISPIANVINAGTGTITLNAAPNTLAAGSVLQLTGSTASVSNAGSLWLGTSNVTGAVNLTTTTAGQGVQLGAGLGTAGQAINIGGVLTVTTNAGAVTDENYGAQSIFGGLTLNTSGGAVTLDAARAIGGLSPRIEYGAVSVNSAAGAIDITETTTLNLGAITTTGGLTARSTTGGIVDSGAFNITGGGATFIVSSAAESVVIDNAGQNIATVGVQGGTNHSILVGSASTLSGSSVTGNLTFASAAGVTTTLGANSVTGNLTVNSGGMITVGGAISVSGNLSLTAADASATSITDGAGASLSVTNVTTLASSGNITLDNAGNDFSSVVFNGVAGNSRVDDANNVSVSGTSSALVDVRSGANNGIGGAFNVVLGNLTVGSLSVTAQDGTGGTGGGISGSITQASGTKIHSEGVASFTTDGSNIVINNTGNNFGRVNASAGNAGITLRENGTIKLGAFSNNGTASTITSETGSIIEDNAVGLATVYSTTNATLTLNAAAGSIQLGRATNVTGGPVTAGASTRIAASAPSGSVQLVSTTANLVVDTVNANSFSLIHTGNGNLTQAGSGIKSFGPASFTSNANMTITNAGNNFGRVTIVGNQTASNTKNITITEGGTLNLGTVTMAGTAGGNFTATSTNGDIIDSGLGGVKLGGVAGGAPAPGTGVVTLVASNGNIILDDPTTDFATTGGVVFRGGNVTLSGLGQTTIWLGAADQPSTAGNLTVTTAIGSIANTGNLNVTGNAFFQAGAGNIAINQTANQFGSIRFVGNQVSIAQTNNMNIQTGSSAIGQAQLASTGGNVTIVNAGGGAVSFGNLVSISASGAITLPKLLQAVGTLTVTAAGTKDLSALSITTDLSNKTPVNLGTGTYLPPQP